MTTHENGDQTVSDERDLKSHQIMELSRELDRVRAERLAAIEAAEAAPESLRERVARALMAEPAHVSWRSRRLNGESGGFYGLTPGDANRLADAAIAVMRGPATCTTCGEAQAAIERVTAVVDGLYDDVPAMVHVRRALDGDS